MNEGFLDINNKFTGDTKESLGTDEDFTTPHSAVNIPLTVDVQNIPYISEDSRSKILNLGALEIDPYAVPQCPSDVNPDDCSSVNPAKTPLERE